MEKVIEKEPQSLSSTIGKAAGVIANERFPSGDRAKLKRMDFAETVPVAFYRFAFAQLPEGWEVNQKEWMTIVAGMAIMSPSNHSPVAGLGKVLAESGYSESRFERLLAAEDEVLYTLILRLARFLAAKAKPADWLQIAQLLLSKDEKADAIRMRIAKDYYRAMKD